MPEQIDVNDIASRIAMITMKTTIALSDGYSQTLVAAELILDAQDRSGDDRARKLGNAIEALQDARSAVPDDHIDEWDECIEALDATT